MAHRGGTVVRFQITYAQLFPHNLTLYSQNWIKLWLQPTRMAEFSQIQSIQTLVSDCKEHAKACIKLRVAGAAETLSITCSSLDQAESLADLIDGYCRLVKGSNTSLWNRKGKDKKFCIIALYEENLVPSNELSIFSLREIYIYYILFYSINVNIMLIKSQVSSFNIRKLDRGKIIPVRAKVNIRNKRKASFCAWEFANDIISH